MNNGEGVAGGPSSASGSQSTSAGEFEPLTQASAGPTFEERADELRVRSVGNRLERLFSIPTLCSSSFNSELLSYEEICKTLQLSLKDLHLDIDLDGAIAKVLDVLKVCRWNCKEVLLEDIMLFPWTSSLCPYCFRCLTPGYGLHFVLDSGISCTAPSDCWVIHWLKMQNCELDPEFVEFVREKMRELVNSVSDVKEFRKNWVTAYHSMMSRGVPETSETVRIIPQFFGLKVFGVRRVCTSKVEL